MPIVATGRVRESKELKRMKEKHKDRCIHCRTGKEIVIQVASPGCITVGRDCWTRTFSGRAQSPVDIVRKYVQTDPSLREKPLSLSYKGVAIEEIVNEGRGWRVYVNSPDPNLHGGPLSDRYKLLQFHSHWGDTCCDGSEHTVNGERFSGELHFVHYNMDMYGTPSTASCCQKGLAVIGVFLTLGKPNPELDKICSVISKIKHKDCGTSAVATIEIRGLLPNDAEDYWTYEGSLTTPPYSESVTWIILKMPIEVSEKQLDEFRSMVAYCKDEQSDSEFEGAILKNWRNPQPREDRVIRQPGKPKLAIPYCPIM